MIQDRDLLMLGLSRFYSDADSAARMAEIVKGGSDLSLRLINWFITNYARDRNVVINKQLEGEMSYVNIYMSYRAQLKTFSKQQFDPFRRNERIRFTFNGGADYIETTVGQLNFFRWALQNGVVDYIRQNKADIEAAEQCAAATGGGGGGAAAEDETGDDARSSAAPGSQEADDLDGKPGSSSLGGECRKAAQQPHSAAAAAATKRRPVVIMGGHRRYCKTIITFD
jgi:hypothetical protein